MPLVAFNFQGQERTLFFVSAVQPDLKTVSKFQHQMIATCKFLANICLMKSQIYLKKCTSKELKLSICPKKRTIPRSEIIHSVLRLQGMDLVNVQTLRQTLCTLSDPSSFVLKGCFKLKKFQDLWLRYVCRDGTQHKI